MKLTDILDGDLIVTQTKVGRKYRSVAPKTKHLPTVTWEVVE